MSVFLPEGGSGDAKFGETSLTPADPNVTQQDVALMQRVLKAAAANPNLIPDAFMAYALDYIQTSRLSIPIGQVFGFAQFTAEVAVVATSETRSSSTYGDLATVGPELDGLPDGHYLLLWGGSAAGSPGVSNANMALSINGGAVPGGDHSMVAGTSFGSFASVMTADTAILSNGANSIVVKYQSSDNTFSCTFATRFLIALRYANK